MSATKIVATIGPATASAETLRQLRAAGMGVVRLNGSHADLDWHAATIALVRATIHDMPILLDIPGRKIRTLKLQHEPSFAAGDTIVLTTDPAHDGRIKVPVNYARLHEDLRAGNTVLADDGTLRFTVTAIEGSDIRCRAEVNGILRSRKGINVPMVTLRTELVTDRDRQMIAFARKHEVDFIGISFVESAKHVELIRECIGGSWPRIVSKIENQGGMQNMTEIIEVSDAIMIDRGDLSVETSLEMLTVFQKRILAAARRAAKPAIVATEMLHTMIENSFPTKAEVSDISNAVIDGCSATMLSGETAVGRFPVQAVDVMRRISDVATGHVQDLLDRDGGMPMPVSAESVPQAMEDAVALICRRLKLTKIVAITVSGYAARVVSARRPRQPILAVSNDHMAARSFNLLPGTEGIYLDVPFSKTSTDHIAICLLELWRQGKLVDDDLILVTAVGFPRSGNRMNLIQTHAVGDLVSTLGWRR